MVTTYEYCVICRGKGDRSQSGSRPGAASDVASSLLAEFEELQRQHVAHLARTWPDLKVVPRRLPAKVIAQHLALAIRSKSGLST
jgi:hypothetical protein